MYHDYSAEHEYPDDNEPKNKGKYDNLIDILFCMA